MATTSETPRRLDLDWVRIGAFALLILYHVGMFYVPWGWHVKSPRIVEGLEPFMRLTNPWRLTLLFLVSGAATRFMADSRERLLGERMGRLLPPLVFGMLLVVPPQTYFQIVENLGYAGGLTAFYARYVTASGHWMIDGEQLITPTWNHLWFVAYLAVYTMVLCAVLKLAGAPFRRLGAWAGRVSGPALLLAPILWLAALRIALFDRFGETHALIDDPYVHGVSLAAFLFGFLIAKEEEAWRRIEALRWPAAALAVASWAIYAGYTWAHRHEGLGHGALTLLIRGVYATDQWTWIVAILGFASRYLRHADGPVRHYLTEAIFPFYIVHQTIIVVAGHYLAKARLALALEAILLIVLTVGGCFTAFEAVRRVDCLRPLFGLKARGRRGGRQAAAAAA